ncbi:MAG: sulfurtransferase TusA family protein [Gammaproteobacteria bacterium]|nr:sulfurtransferase TusA family protein [Gammaproteobacteria bacterium]
MTHQVLDARYLLCPLPVIRTQQAITKLVPGDTLEVHATDPGVLHDIPAWCRVHGHEVIGTNKVEGEIHVTVRVKAA